MILEKGEGREVDYVQGMGRQAALQTISQLPDGYTLFPLDSHPNNGDNTEWTVCDIGFFPLALNFRRCMQQYLARFCQEGLKIIVCYAVQCMLCITSSCTTIQISKP